MTKKNLIVLVLITWHHIFCQQSPHAPKLNHTLLQEIPIILCEGSGLATDILATGIRMSQKNADYKLSKEQEQVLIKLMETQLRSVVTFYHLNKEVKKRNFGPFSFEPPPPPPPKKKKVSGCPRDKCHFLTECYII